MPQKIIVGARQAYITELDKHKKPTNKKSTLIDKLPLNLVNIPFIQQLYPSDRLLIDMNIHSYVGIPLKNNLGDVDSILVALFEENIESVHEVETLFLLFSGLELQEEKKKDDKKKKKAAATAKSKKKKKADDDDDDAMDIDDDKDEDFNPQEESKKSSKGKSKGGKSAVEQTSFLPVRNIL